METPPAAAQLLDRYVDWIVAERPVEATRLGEHSRDAELPDLAPDTVASWSRTLGALRRDVEDARARATDPEERGDLLLLADALDGRLFQLDDRRRMHTDPLVTLDLATDGVHELSRRARLAGHQGESSERWLIDVVQRLREVPRLVEQGASLLEGSPTPHRTVALSRIAGARDLLAQHTPRLVAELGGDAEAARAAGQNAAEAIAAYGALLEELDDAEPLPWRLGPEAHETALRTALGSRMSATEVVARAQAAFSERRERLAELAGELWDEVVGQGTPPSDPDERSRAVLAAVGRDACARDQLVPRARDAVVESIGWCERSGVVGVPDTTQLAVEEVPEYQQGLFVAYLMPAPPLEPDAGSTYFLSPVPDAWDDDRAASFLREYNRWALKALAVHEAYPGHFLQLDRATRHPRLVRRLLGSSAFAEGWAVYVEHLVQDVASDAPDDPVLGIYAHPSFRLIELKMQLRVAANALLDVGLHAGEFDDAAAMDLMVRGAFQEEAEAAGKLVRAKVTSGQLCSYFVGHEEVSDLRRDAETAWGSSFSLRRFHDEILAHGTPPVGVLREALLDDVTVAPSATSSR